MKIYNKGYFISGIVMVLLGVLNLGLGIARKDLDISLGLLLLGLFALGVHFIYRSMNKKLSTVDKIEKMDERNQFVLLKNRSSAFQIQKYVYLGLTTVCLVVAAIQDSKMFEYIGTGFGLAFVISLFLDIVTFIYFERKN